MSPTLSDDLLVRDLHERADRLLPAMSLEPAAVLLASRRHRRRQTAVRSAAGVLAVGAFVVGAVQIWADEPIATPPAGAQQEPRPMGNGQTVELAPGVIAANRPVETTLDDGTAALDLGLTAGAIDAGGAWVQDLPLLLTTADAAMLGEMNALLSNADRPVHLDLGVSLLRLGEATPHYLRLAWPRDDTRATYGGRAYPIQTDDLLAGEDAYLYAGAVPSWLSHPRVIVYSNGGVARADGTTVHFLEIPTYSAPTDDARLLYTLKVPVDPESPAGDEPVDVVFFVGSDRTVEGGTACPGISLDRCAESFPALLTVIDGPQDDGTDDSTPSIQVAENVRVIETDMGPAVDLLVTVEDPQLVDPNQVLTYILSVTTVGEMAPEDAVLTPEEREGPAVLLSTLAADGTTLNGSGGDLATHRATSDGSPMYMSGLSDHDVYVLGMLPPGSGAALELVVEHAAGAERTPVPAFRVPGLPDDFFFVALHHDEVTFADWPTIYVELTAGDGATRRWTLGGVELFEAAPESKDIPADQG